MERRFLLFVLIILLPALIISSCTKDNPPDTAVVTKDWHWHEWGRDFDNDGTIDPSEITNVDIKYVHFIFNTDGTGKYDDYNYPAVPFNWSFPNGNYIEIDFSTPIPEFVTNVHHIDSLTLHDFVISDTDKNGRKGFYHFQR